MRRWHEDYKISYREWKKHYRYHVQLNVDSSCRWRNGERVLVEDVYEVDCPCDTQVGRFRKKDAWDCGHTRCYVCHSDKLPKRTKTYQELCADLKLKEGIDEYSESGRPT